MIEFEVNNAHAAVRRLEADHFLKPVEVEKMPKEKPCLPIQVLTKFLKLALMITAALGSISADANASDRLNPNEDLVSIGSIQSPNGKSSLVMQGDGNMVLYRSAGKARWATNTAGKVVANATMQGDGNFVMYGPGRTYLWDTGTYGHPGAFLIVQDDGNVVIYDATGNPLWASNTAIAEKSVTGFLPSTSGFHFSNESFPHVPDLSFDFFGQRINIGDAATGLCGGMVFAVRDFFEAGQPIPPDLSNPSSGPLFNYMVKRLFDSFNLLLPPPPPPAPPFVGFITPAPPFGPGPLTYAHLMNPDLPDHETFASQAGLSFHGRAWITIVEQWPKIKSDLDSGHLSPIALVELKDHDISKMGDNHQVLAYGYSVDGTDLSIHIYDPNHPDEDDIVLSLNTAQPTHTTKISSSVNTPVWAFFQPVYSFSQPPGATATPQGPSNPVDGGPIPPKPDDTPVCSRPHAPKDCKEP